MTTSYSPRIVESFIFLFEAGIFRLHYHLNVSYRRPGNFYDSVNVNRLERLR